MISLLLILFFLAFILWLGYQLTGALLMGCIWLFIKIPASLILLALALICCCTIILIPIGVGLFKTGFKLLIPGI